MSNELTSFSLFLKAWLPKDGWDGETSIDSFIALAAMAPITKNILVISSIHVLYGPLHPLHIAKYGATLDHISKGRWGINILTGHRAVEHQMFGWNRIEHDKRYEMTGELFDVVNSLWGETEGLTYEGRLNPWKLQNAWISPKPLYGRPILVNATGSAAGIDFAVRYSDLIFITSPGGASIEAAIATLPDHIANIRKKAQSTGRTIKILINPIILSRDTVEETEDYLQKIVAAQGDTPHSHPQVRYESDAHAWRGRKDSNYPQGYNLGANIEVIGTPAPVVEQLKFLHEIGIDGVQFTFYDWVIDFDHFAAKILPLLKDAGLRVD